MGQFDDVDTPGLAYQAMAEAGRWGLLDDLESTVRMIAGGEKWLKKKEAESDLAYKNRLNGNSLYGMFSRAVKTMVSKPFSRAIKFPDDVTLPPRLEVLLKDIDGEGNGLTHFFKSVFKRGAKYGVGHVLVNFSKVEQNLPGDDGELSPAMQVELDEIGARSRAIEISPVNLIDWDPIVVDGNKVLNSIRFRGTRTIREKFSQRVIRTVTHYQRDRIDVYTKDGDDDWALDPENSTVNTLGRVPLESFYTNWKGFMEAEPPYLELAETNLKHWQVSAGYYTLLEIVPISRFMTWGFDDDEAEAASLHSATKAIHARSKDAGGQWIEHSGKGLGSIETSLQKLEDRGAAQSSQPTSREKSAVTATGERRDASDAVCDLHSWIDSLESLIVRVVKTAAEWQGDEFPEEWEPVVYRGFTIGREAFEEMELIQKDADAGRIPAHIAVREGQRRGMYGDDVDPIEASDAGAQEMQDKLANGIGNSDPGTSDDLEE